MSKMKTPAGEDLAENLDREMQKFKFKVRINYICRLAVPRLTRWAITSFCALFRFNND